MANLVRKSNELFTLTFEPEMKVKSLTEHLSDLREQMMEQRKMKQRYGLLQNTASVLPNVSVPATPQFAGHFPSTPNIHYTGMVECRVSYPFYVSIYLFYISIYISIPTYLETHNHEKK